MLLIILVLLVLLALGGGYWAGPQYGYVGYGGPLVAVLVIVLALLLLGVL
jgi:hypothetical protein